MSRTTLLDRRASPSGPYGSRSLGELLESVPDAHPPAGSEATPVSGIAADSRNVAPGSLFVALRGSRIDGHAYMDEAVRRGAGALLVERPPAEDPGVPVVQVTDSRSTLADLAAAWYRHPARRLRLVGITGTVGKTSVLTMMGAILRRASARAGLLGSLGLKGSGDFEPTGFTAPGPLLLHAELAQLADQGCELAIMEVTSHALSQQRVHGLRFDLGVFTNLLPLEHADYHGSFRAYVRSKLLFFEQLAPGAPIVFNADDPAVRQLMDGRDVRAVSAGRAEDASVRVAAAEVTSRGTRLILRAERPLPRPWTEEEPPFEVSVRLALLGRANVANAALAATAAICAGAPPDVAAEVLSHFPPPKRRMQIVHRGRYTVLDDTVGHPDSISALFEVVEKLGPRRVHAAYVVRGRRGPEINRRLAEALVVWRDRVPLDTLVVTCSQEAADALNSVEPDEYRAFVRPLKDARVPFRERERLDDAVHEVLEQAGREDLVLLLGAQGMDQGQDILRAWLAERAEAVDGSE